MVKSADIEAIERATIAAVSPQAVEELPEGWLLPFDSGTVSRAKTALPLRHVAPGPGPALVERIEARYHAHGLPPAFRLPDAPCFDAMREALAHRGYGACKATVTQIGHAQAMGKLAAGAPAALDAAPDAGWESVFLGPGFDPVDGASRVRALSRASGTLFASVRENGRTVAAGAIAFGHGWASVHGMRTEQAARGRGLAGRVLAGLAQAALARGVERVFLQVEAGNAAALSLYRRAGFSPAWRYAYWQPA